MVGTLAISIGPCRTWPSVADAGRSVLMRNLPAYDMELRQASAQSSADSPSLGGQKIVCGRFAGSVDTRLAEHVAPFRVG